MQKILVTTDLSDNSKAGIRFAIQLANQAGYALTFFYVHQVWSADSWNKGEIAPDVQLEKKELTDEFDKFIKGIYKSVGINPGKYDYKVLYSIRVADSIMEYAEELRYDYICIATHGAGVVKKLIGTHTSKLIGESATPVLCIPKNYRRRPLTQVLYASDGKAYQEELKTVIAFAKPLNAAVDMLHLNYWFEPVPDEALAEPVLEKQLRYPVDIRYEQRDSNLTVQEQIEKSVNKIRPSLLVMFTNRQRSFFEKLLLSSVSKEFSFYTKTPMLIYNKG